MHGMEVMCFMEIFIKMNLAKEFYLNPNENVLYSQLMLTPAFMKQLLCFPWGNIILTSSKVIFFLKFKENYSVFNFLREGSSGP